jgi:Fe2+ or Zn2+ uptake regulation protein
MKGESPRVATALAALEHASLRRTPQRLAIVRAFVDDPTHPTAQQIFDRLRRAMPTMSFATVYNTLAALEKAGSCRVLRVHDDGSARFDPRVDPHDHAICDECGAVRDLEIESRPVHERGSRGPRRAPSVTQLEGGFHVRAVERVYRGLCADCSSSTRSS